MIMSPLMEQNMRKWQKFVYTAEKVNVDLIEYIMYWKNIHNIKFK